MIRRPE